MSHPYAEVVKVVTVDAETGAEGDVYYGVACGDDEGYAVTRSFASLDELKEAVGDLSDQRALWAHAEEHYPDQLGPYGL